jgi:uncharacterized protein (DUF983 family)
MEQPVGIPGDGAVAPGDGQVFRGAQACPARCGADHEGAAAPGGPPHLEVGVVILGAILLIIGLIASLSILVWIGIILLVVGLVLNLVPIGGTRRRYY